MTEWVEDPPAAIVGFAWTIAAIGVLTFVSGLIVAALMKEQPR